MSKCFTALAVVLGALVLTAVAAVAQQPQIGNGRLTTRSGGSLPQAFKAAVAAQTDVGWIGYAVPAVDGDRTMCCVGADGSGAGCCSACRLEPSERGEAGGVQSSTGPIKLESPDVVVLFRVANRQVERIRVFSETCALDAGGREVVWLTGVSPVESVALLESLATAGGSPDRTTNGAIMAIALHRETAADAALERLVAPSQPEDIRGKVPLWLGNARGARGLAALQRLIRDDPSVSVKKKAAFGISQSPLPKATDLLIDVGRTHADAQVRGEAIFWLAQKAGNRAAQAITERIENDPDTEVKKRAVFALSQLPKSEGVPLLINVARTNPNPAVKKQAMFWLGQSRDPKALEFFAEVLK
jgi:HEAT repeat protein